MTIQANTSPREGPEEQRAGTQSVGQPETAATMLVDCDGIVLSWSATAQALLGYAAAEIIGRRLDTCYTPEARASGLLQQHLKRSSLGGLTEDEAWRVRKDGSRFWAKVAMTALTDTEGKTVGHAVTTLDLTVRQLTSGRSRRRDELLRSEERFRLLVDSVQDYAIFMLDAQGIVATWNSGAERIKGYKAEEVIGRHFSLFRTAEDTRSGVCERELLAAARDGKLEEEGWRVRKDGSRFWANVVLTAIHDRNGELLGFAKVTRDLTQRRLLDDERLQRARAEEAVRLRDEFLLMAAHELRTPLTSLRLDLYGIKQDVSRSQIAKDVSRIVTKVDRAVRNSERQAALIDSLLNVSRLAHGKLVLKPVVLDLVQVVEHSVEGIRSQAMKAGCEIMVSATGSLPGVWDRLRMEQVFMNLLSNAVKYGAGLPVEVRVFADGWDAAVEIGDHGPGIPEPDLERIFNRFERASSSSNQGGLGLGLYVSREIIRAHAGSIRASNRAGGGATFTVHLPMRRDEVSTTAGET